MRDDERQGPEDRPDETCTLWHLDLGVSGSQSTAVVLVIAGFLVFA